jgi:hypothetical protein
MKKIKEVNPDECVLQVHLSDNAGDALIIFSGVCNMYLCLARQSRAQGARKSTGKI